MRLLPGWLVDAMPERWWRAANLHRTPLGDLHFCFSLSGPRNTERNGREIAVGRRPFVGEHEDPPEEKTP
jgi:hypothetical protein